MSGHSMITPAKVVTLFLILKICLLSKLGSYLKYFEKKNSTAFLSLKKENYNFSS